MSTLSLRVPLVWPRMSRLGAVFATVVEIFSEARRLSIAAQAAYPRAEW